MALTHGLDFAIAYACALGLFSYLAFWFVPRAARLLWVAVKDALVSRERGDSPPPSEGHWFDPIAGAGTRHSHV